MAAAGESITITSHTMTAEGGARRVLFDGMVVLTKKDFVMRSDAMVVTFEEDTRDDSGQPEERALSQSVQRVEATGNVVLERSDGRASGGRAVYYKHEEKVVLTESPAAWHNGTKVTGKRMTIFLKEDRSIVEGDSRVTIVEEQGR